MGKRAAVQGGHLALSAFAGAVHAGTFGQKVSIVGSGKTFGLAFYLLAHVATGSSLRLKAPEWRLPRDVVVQHVMVHLSFGLLTALGARIGVAITRRR